MIDVFLPLAIKNTGISLAARLNGLPMENASIREVRDICTCYRVLAIGHLLLSADPADYSGNLCKSGLCWLHYLRKNKPNNQASSWGIAFFDSVSCLDSNTALSIAKQSPATHNSLYEYEEDFLYIKFVMQYYAGELQEKLNVLLDSWRILLNGSDDARYSLCEALLGSDHEILEEALLAAIEAVQQELITAGEMESISADNYSALAHVSTEVVAWLQLCRAKGLALEDDYALAPSPAVLTRSQVFPAADSWRFLAKTYNSLQGA